MNLFRLIRVRCIQGVRLMREIGIFRIIFLGMLAVFLLLVAWGVFNDPAYQFGGIVCVVVTVFFIHTQRKDRKFIRLYGLYPLWMFWGEYVLLLLPLEILLLFTSAWYAVFLLLFSVFLISAWKVSPRRIPVLSFPSRWVPAYNFEWKSGLRRYPGIWIFYFSGLLLSFLPFLSLIAIWLVGMIVAGFYEDCEPVEVLVAEECDPVRFLGRKIRRQGGTYLLFISPIVILYAWFNPSTWYLTTVFLVVNLFCCIFFIVNKYAAYRPGHRHSLGMFFSVLVLISNLVLPLFIWSVVMMIRSYRKALRKMNIYLYDFDTRSASCLR